VWNGSEKPQFLRLRFCRSRRKSSALKSLVGALPTDWGSALSVGRQLKMETRARTGRSTLRRLRTASYMLEE